MNLVVSLVTLSLALSPIAIGLYAYKERTRKSTGEFILHRCFAILHACE